MTTAGWPRRHHVEYDLPEKGVALRPIVLSLMSWGDDFCAPEGSRRCSGMRTTAGRSTAGDAAIAAARRRPPGTPKSQPGAAPRFGRTALRAQQDGLARQDSAGLRQLSDGQIADGGKGELGPAERVQSMQACPCSRFGRDMQQLRSG